MRYVELNDSELAVIIDSLDFARRKIMEDSPHTETPTINSAINRINRCITPETTGAVLVTN